MRTPAPGLAPLPRPRPRRPARHCAAAFTLIELMVVIAVLAIILAITVPSYLRSRMVGNEASASATLRNFVTLQATWRQNDVDRNSVADYWTADVSGFYRIEASPAGSTQMVAQIDAAIAGADDNKLSAGAGVVAAPMPDSGIAPASLLAFIPTASKSGYWFRALVNDLSILPGAAYATDPDANGQAWSNTAGFAFQARPERYSSTGLNTFIVNQAGVVYKRDFGTNLPDNAANWPAANPVTFGFGPVQ
ncbi:MAG: DUF2950 family protein [Planctomycetes bacterium]|nr:DUF2950 family protein [Planctomycetota bacterium]